VVVQGPSSTLFFDTETEPHSTSLAATVPVGAYTAFLQEGWRLERSSEGEGKGEALPARLVSENPVSFEVTAGGSTIVPLRFAVGGAAGETGDFDLVLEVEEEDTGEPGAICSTDADCGAGQTCCRGGFLGTCQAAGATCALPDLTVSADVARNSLQLVSETFAADSCALDEGCIDGPGTRRLLRFATQTANVGGSDIVLGDPSGTPGFEFAECHGHAHFEGYARYQLLDASGAVAATGHKQAFCLLDSAPVGIPGAPAAPRFHCGFQGIQRGWSDIYGAGLDCQWVDVTDVPPGEYTLRIEINPDRVIQEGDYGNNVATVAVRLGNLDPLAECLSPTSGVNRDCGWALANERTGLSCQPGQPLTVGCGCSAGGLCQGDAMLRICEGTAACTSAEALTASDDSCGLCPEATFACPASGTFSVLTTSFNSSVPALCTPVVAASSSGDAGSGSADAGAK
jgi:hypothetical protein